jgi:flagellar protein FliO/FliZ
MSLSSLLPAILALGGIVALLLLVPRVLLRLRPRLAPAYRGGSAMAVEQVLALDMRRRVLLVRCGDRRVLLLTGGAQDLVLGWLDAPAAESP